MKELGSTKEKMLRINKVSSIWKNATLKFWRKIHTNWNFA